MRSLRRPHKWTPYGKHADLRRTALSFEFLVITFSDERHALQSVIVSVKSGQVGSPMVLELKGAIENEKAAIGLFVTLEEPTTPMRVEASTAGR